MPRPDNFVDVAGFFATRDACPFPLRGDFYTVCGEAFASADARRRSVYNMTNRRSPMGAWPGVARDGRMVFYGLSHWVRECLPPAVLGAADDGSAAAFMARSHSFGGGLAYDPSVWERARHEFGGNLPVRIEAFAEGETFWANEPCVQVTSLGEGYGEVAALVEATLLGMVSCATARATLARHLLGRVREEVKLDNPDLRSFDEVQDVAEWLVHDFGMRASSTPLEAEVFGTAHLLSFRGTDTTPAAYHAWLTSDDPGDVGTSVLAHAHRIIQGYDDEGDAVRALADAADRCGDVPVASYLADTYGFVNFVENLALPLALEFRRRGRGVVVVRGDSGDADGNAEFVVRKAFGSELCRVDRNGRVAATHMKFIAGDSMTYAKTRSLYDHLRSAFRFPLNATSWGGVGIGGWLRREATRDALSSAYKLAAKGAAGTPVAKLSEVREKMSVPGEVGVWRFDADPKRPTVYPAGRRPVGGRPAYVTYYDGSMPGDAAYGGVLFEPFASKRARAVGGYHAHRFAPPDKGGPDYPVLSEGVVALQRAAVEAHGKTFGPVGRVASRERS